MARQIDSDGWRNILTYQEIKNNEEVKEFLRKGNESLDVLGYTDHSETHCTLVAERAAEI